MPPWCKARLVAVSHDRHAVVRHAIRHASTHANAAAYLAPHTLHPVPYTLYSVPQYAMYPAPCTPYFYFVLCTSACDVPCTLYPVLCTSACNVPCTTLHDPARPCTTLHDPARPCTTLHPKPPVPHPSGLQAAAEQFAREYGALLDALCAEPSCSVEGFPGIQPVNCYSLCEARCGVGGVGWVDGVGGSQAYYQSTATACVRPGVCVWGG